MYINPYGAEPVALGVALANEPPPALDELSRRCADFGVTMDMPIVPGDLEFTHTFLHKWERLADLTDEAARAEALNALLAAHAKHPRLTNHDGENGWHLHYRDDGVTLGPLLATLITVGTAIHLTSRGMRGLDRCASVDCDRVVADLSRNGTQRYCSPRCGSREAVRRHRAKVGGAGVG